MKEDEAFAEAVGEAEKDADELVEDALYVKYSFRKCCRNPGLLYNRQTPTCGPIKEKSIPK